MEIFIIIIVAVIIYGFFKITGDDEADVNQNPCQAYQKPPKPQWIHLSKLKFGDGGPITKSQAKSYFREYLKLCGFSKDYISDTLEDFSLISSENIDELRIEIADLKDEISNYRENIRELKKQMKLDKSEGKLKRDELLEVLKNTEIDIEAEEEALKELKEDLLKLQAKMKAIKTDWKSYLLKYIETNTSYGWVLKNKPETMKEV